MTEHTKEPWQTWGSVHSGNVYVVPKPYSGAGNIALFCKPEDAARATACLNACHGIPTEALEAGIVGDMVEALRDTTASLTAAVSLLGRGPKTARLAAPSDKMFDLMLHDYEASLDRARSILSKLGGTNGK